jgi:hypothetical protein
MNMYSLLSSASTSSCKQVGGMKKHKLFQFRYQKENIFLLILKIMQIILALYFPQKKVYDEIEAFELFLHPPRFNIFMFCTCFLLRIMTGFSYRRTEINLEQANTLTK